MDSSLIETEGISLLKLDLIRSEIIKPNFKENDKTLSWDGDMELYKSKNFNKENLFARIPVQIKSTTIGNIDSEKYNLPVSKADLNNYFNDGGVVFFVILIKSRDNYKIFYDTLTKLKLKKYLNLIKANQESHSIMLSIFPKDDPEEYKTIFFQFAQEIKMPISERILSMDDLREYKPMGIDRLSVSYIGDKYKNDPLAYFFTHPTTVYAHYTTTDISFPVDIILLKDINRTTPVKISINGVVYYDQFKNIRNENGYKLIFGESLTLINKVAENTITFDFKIKGNLSQRINDIKFFMAFLTSNTIGFDDNIVNIPIKEEMWSKVNPDYTYENFEKQLNYLLEAKRALEKLNIHKELDCDNFTVQDEQNLHLLIDAILYEKPQRFDIKEISRSTNMRLRISNLTIMLLLTKINDSEYLVENFFTKAITIEFYSQKNKKNRFRSTQYLLLSKKDFLTLSNLDYEDMVNAIMNLGDSKELFERINMFILSMLQAHDESDKTDNKLLLTSLRITEWLISKEKENKRIIIYKLNKIQIIKRIRKLQLDEINFLTKLTEEIDDDFILTGTYLLLDNKDMASVHYKRLRKDERKNFDELPISIFR
jgi:hypothetical protein